MKRVANRQRLAINGRINRVSRYIPLVVHDHAAEVDSWREHLVDKGQPLFVPDFLVEAVYERSKWHPLSVSVLLASVPGFVENRGRHWWGGVGSCR